MVSGSARVKEVQHAAQGNDHVVTVTFDGNLRHVAWRMQANGWLRLDYRYHLPPGPDQQAMGVSFGYPEKNVKSMRWLGQGPHRVWKNRLKGVEFDVWEKAYNDTMTGLSWDYPEFKGFHANVQWAQLATTEGPITMVLDAEDVYLRVFTPSTPEGPGLNPGHAQVKFPAGDLSFLHGIAGIGTKFHPPEAHGPAGMANMVPRHGRTYEATAFFRFGE
jgi:hypothetical protein